MTTNAAPSYTPREIVGQPSTERTLRLKQRYLDAPLVIDAEYPYLLMQGLKQAEGLPAILRRAESHAFAVENLTPTVREDELIVGSKTRFVRGAVPYLNYATEFLLRELRKQEQTSAESQAQHIDLGTGGGISRAQELARQQGWRLIASKFLIPPAELKRLEEAAEYFRGRSMQDVGDRFWKGAYRGANYIEEGWRIGLFTAPHDTCPEGRFVLAFDLVLERGLLALIEDMEQRIAAQEVTVIEEAQKVWFWQAGVRVCWAALRWCERHAAEARRQAEACADDKRRTELLRIAEALEHAPAHPPRNFFEALQAFWAVYLLGHLEGAHLGYSPGRFDQFLASFYLADRQAGRLAQTEALELLECLRVKMTEIEYIASFSWEGLGSGNLFQNMMLGGLDRAGQPGENELSELVLESAVSMQTTQPTLSIWWHARSNERFLAKAVEVVKTGCGFPAFFNQELATRHFLLRDRASLEDARDGAMGGCTEPQIQGACYGVVQPGFINHGKLLELALHRGRDPRSGHQVGPETDEPTGFDSLKTAYLAQLETAMRHWQRYWNYVMAAHHETVPLVFCSVLTHDCIEKGRSLDDRGARYNASPTTLSSGMVNVVNALAAVRALVDEEHVVTLRELKEAMAANWEGRQELRRYCLEAPKFGNDDERVDAIARDLFTAYCAMVPGQKSYLGEPYDPSMLSISTHTPFGKACEATPDGRQAGEPLADAVLSPMPGTDRHGPTAVIRSATKIDCAPMRGGQLNLKFHPTALAGEDGTRKLLALLKTYFELGGPHVQFNVVDSVMLREAQTHPEKYRDLMVRVAGFSAYWVELSPSLQEQIIARTEHGL